MVPVADHGNGNSMGRSCKLDGEVTDHGFDGGPALGSLADTGPVCRLVSVSREA
jgi:hypothetical protein